MKYLIIAILLASCTSTGTRHNTRLDTVPQALFYLHDKKGKKVGPYLDSAIIEITSHWVFQDSMKETGGHWKVDSDYWGRILDDTLRDSVRRPLYDTGHHPRWHYAYYLVPDSLIQRVTIKR
jgi:hypothetical protein